MIELQPEAEQKPLVIGNCQAGWAVMMLAAARPDLFGAVLIAGAPLSYWNGVHGKNPMRYTGGLLGGSWLTALSGDLGNGKFDGTNLVSNFESLNPANTLWTKQYNLWSKVDTEAERYLGFERWWGNHVLLNAEEMQVIADELFIGNRLATAEIVTKAGVRLDLREIKAPIVCFCSKGDNITPPQQALGWILDLYHSVEDIRAQEQTIVYAMHDSIGHLGIFVSGKVAKKEYAEFTSNIDLIDVLPPGLYEAVLVPKSAEDDNADLIFGDFLIRFEARTLDDIRALGGNDEEDERRFAAVARVSEINHGLYRTFMQPWIRASVSEEQADLLRRCHPLRLQFSMFSDENPLMRPVAQAAEWVRANRAPADPDNPLALVAAECLRGDRRVPGRLSRPPRPAHGGDLPRRLRQPAAAGDGGAARLGRAAAHDAGRGPGPSCGRSRRSARSCEAASRPAARARRSCAPCSMCACTTAWSTSAASTCCNGFARSTPPICASPRSSRCCASSSTC